VKDRNGCVSTGTAATVAAQLTAAAVVTKTLDCPGAPDAVIQQLLELSYTVHCRGVHCTTTVSSNTDTYTFVITDANGCTTTTATTVYL
jgi:hypothetical protein